MVLVVHLLPRPVPREGQPMWIPWVVRHRPAPSFQLPPPSPGTPFNGQDGPCQAVSTRPHILQHPSLSLLLAQFLCRAPVVMPREGRVVEATSLTAMWVRCSSNRRRQQQQQPQPQLMALEGTLVAWQRRPCLPSKAVPATWCRVGPQVYPLQVPQLLQPLLL